MPSSNTFSIKPIKELVTRYTEGKPVVLDPFARNCKIGTHRNDLNPETEAEYHLDALEFLEIMYNRELKADVVLFDPPYSLRQCCEVYESVGRKPTMRDTQMFGRWTECKSLISSMLTIGGISISCGWNSQGMGLQNGFQIEEILLVCHGGAHNDTIVTVERKIQGRLL